MNENMKRLARQATEYCIGEHSEEDETTGPIPWGWEFKFTELIVKECVDLMPVCPERLKIMDYFGLDSPEARKTRLMTEFIESMKVQKIIGYWSDIPGSEWPPIIELVKGKVPIDSGFGTHCSNDVYLVDNVEYDITHDWNGIVSIRKHEKHFN